MSRCQRRTQNGLGPYCSRSVKRGQKYCYQHGGDGGGGTYRFDLFKMNEVFNKTNFGLYQDFKSKLDAEDMCGWGERMSQIRYLLQPVEDNLVFDVYVFFKVSEGVITYYSFAIINNSHPLDELFIEYICSQQRGGGETLLHHLINIANESGKKYITLKSVMAPKTIDFYFKNGFYVNRKIYNVGEQHNLTFKEAIENIQNNQKPDEKIISIIEQSTNKIIEYSDANKLLVTIPTAYFRLKLLNQINTDDQEVIHRLTAEYDQLIDSMDQSQDPIQVIMKHTQLISGEYKNIDELYNKYKSMLTQIKDKPDNKKLLSSINSSQVNLGEKYKYTNVTLVPMILPVFKLSNQVVDFKGSVITKSNTRLNGKSDQELLETYK